MNDNQQQPPTAQVQKRDEGIERAIKRIKHRIVVFSGKGGVGKTTVAVNLAYALSGSGLKVGLLDADITGPNVPHMTGLVEGLSAKEGMIVPSEMNGIKIISIASMVEGGTPIIWRGPLRSKVIDQFIGETQWGDLDVMIADLPPGTGDEVLTIAQHTSPDMAIIVTTPQEVALIDARRAANMAKKLEIKNIGILENMSSLICPHCGRPIDLFGSGGGELEAQKLGLLFFGKVPIDPQTRAQADNGHPIVLEAPESAISKAFFAAAKTVWQSLE